MEAKNRSISLGYTIQDIVWGEIYIEPRFAWLLSLPEYQKMTKKRQLGLTYCNPQYLGNGMHSRYQHSIGVYYLTNLLINKLKEKMGDSIKITDRDADVLKILACSHDIGHGPFSHAFESIIGVSHECSTIQVLESLKEKIDHIFGIGITEEVIKLFKSKEMVKKESIYFKEASTEFTILVAFIDLLAGAIDVDRIDYISRDLTSITGQKKDFSKIFDYISFDIIDDMPQIVFLEEGINLIEDYFFTRFRNYKDIYFAMNTVVRESLFQNALQTLYRKEELSINTQEIEIENRIKEEAISPNVQRARMCSLVFDQFDENVLMKSFSNLQDMNLFKKEVEQYITFDVSYMGYIKKSITVYNPDKNKVYIKKTSGETEDLLNASAIIKTCITQDIFYAYIDLKMVEIILESRGNSREEIQKTGENITHVFTKPKYEIEKKYTLSEKISLQTVLEYFEDGTEFISKGVKENKDIYYYTGTDEIVARKRQNGQEYTWTIKSKVKDETSLTKRGEANYPDLSEEQFLTILNQMLLNGGITKQDHLVSIMSIETIRNSFITYYHGSKMEISMDRSFYRRQNQIELDEMVEIELMEGSTIGLFWFTQQLTKLFYLDPCKDAKLTRAKQKLNIT